MIKSAAEMDTKVEWIPTGISSLDKILGGGVPTKRITEISGPYSVGKTTLALTVVAQAQTLKYKTLWVDQEWSWEGEYAVSLGVDLNKTFLIQERFAEIALDMVEAWADENKDGLIVIDAIGALLPRQEAEKSNEGKTIGGQAGLVAKFCRKIVPLLALHNISLVVLNHEFTDIMSGRIMTSGGRKLEYHKAVWLKLRKLSKNITQGDAKIGEFIEAEIRKHKLVGTVRQTCELSLLFGKGFSAEADLFQEALDKGVITKDGQSYFFADKKLGRGLNAAREALTEEIMQEIKEIIHLSR